MSNPKFEFEPRPDKLKFIDKHGNISYRTNPNTPESIAAKAEDIPAAAPSAPTVDTDELRRRQLLTEMVDLHIQKINPYLNRPTPEEIEAKRAELIKTYPLYEKYEHRESLSLADLQLLQETVKQMSNALGEQRKSLAVGLFDLYWELRDSLTDCDYEHRGKRDEAIEAAYPSYGQVGDRWQLNFHELEAAIAELETLKQKLETDGDAEFLPEEYFKQQKQLEAERKDEASMERLVDAAHDAGEAGEEAFEAMIKSEERFVPIMGDENLAHWVSDDYLSKFITAYNRNTDKENRVPSKGRSTSKWHLEDQEPDILEQTERGWKGIKRACEERPEWVDTFIFDTCCAMSTIEFSTRGFAFKTIEDFTLEPETPLTADERLAIVKAAYLAAENAYYALGRRKNLPTFKTVKRAAG